MRYLVQGGEDAETVELLLGLTRIDSDDVKSALKDYLVADWVTRQRAPCTR